MKNKITAKDLQFYIGLPCAIYELNSDDTINKNIDPVSHYIEGVDINEDKIIAERAYWKPHQIKPILKNLEEISVRETIHISCTIMGYDSAENEDQKIRWNKNDKTDIKEFGFIQFDKSDSIFMPHVILYLMKQGYNLHLLPSGSYLIENKGGRAIETPEE